MHDILHHIIQEKYQSIDALKEVYQDIDLTQIKQSPPRRSFQSAIHRNHLTIIAEIKRRSPSKGKLSNIAKPIELVDQYVKGGAAAISVLTDPLHFSGSIEDLKHVSHHLRNSHVPVLRKDFIVDKIQIIEAISSGAHAILLIVSVLTDKTKELLDYAKSLRIDALVEVHDKKELRFAIDIGATIIGINNRNLHTFEQDINICLQLAPLIPAHITKIAESAIRTTEDIHRIKAAGFHSALIGEALVTSNNPTLTLKAMLETP
jgi:indole-3-glycerol phosphate synthase